jgi:hypothetical protein
MRILFLFLISLVLLGCNSNTESTAISNDTLITSEESITKYSEVVDPDKLLADFRTELRSGKSDWNLEDSYTDTLEFIEYNENSDYPYAIFKTREGKEIILNNSKVIDNYYRNRNFKVTWKVGKFYEAGEGDVLYFKEQVTALAMLPSSFSFEKFLKAFVSDYRKGEDGAIKKYSHAKVPYVSASNPGAYCVLGEPYPERRKDFITKNFIVSSQKPKGDFCEGYPEAKDGFYYSFFGEGHLPHYANMAEDGGAITPFINEDVIYF